MHSFFKWNNEDSRQDETRRTNGSDGSWRHEHMSVKMEVKRMEKH